MVEPSVFYSLVKTHTEMYGSVPQWKQKVGKSEKFR